MAAAQFLGRTFREIIENKENIEDALKCAIDDSDHLKAVLSTSTLIYYKYDETFENIENIISFRYYCKRTHMLEVLFPIFIDDIVAGVLITGQLIPDVDVPIKIKDHIRKTCRNLFEETKVTEFGLNEKGEPLDFDTFFGKMLIHSEDEINRIIGQFAKEVERQQICLKNRSQRNWSHFRLRAAREIRKNLEMRIIGLRLLWRRD